MLRLASFLTLLAICNNKNSGIDNVNDRSVMLEGSAFQTVVRGRYPSGTRKIWGISFSVNIIRNVNYSINVFKCV